MTAPVAIGIMGIRPAGTEVRRALRHQASDRHRPAHRARSRCAATRPTRSCRRSVGGILVRIVFGAGMGLTTAPRTESIMGSLPPGKAGVGSAVNDTTRQTGGALGVAVLGSIFALRYHAVIRAATGVPENIRDQVKDSIGKALEAAQRARWCTGRGRRRDRPQRVHRLDEARLLPRRRRRAVRGVHHVARSSRSSSFRGRALRRGSRPRRSDQRHRRLSGGESERRA
mgnify:CR=1 FL=1